MQQSTELGRDRLASPRHKHPGLYIGFPRGFLNKSRRGRREKRAIYTRFKSSQDPGLLSTLARLQAGSARGDEDEKKGKREGKRNVFPTDFASYISDNQSPPRPDSHARHGAIARPADATAAAERKSTEINTRACKRAR